MAVEIIILSGSRQGERLLLDATNFRAGTDPGCDVFFDPRRDACTENRSASFRLMEDGWYMVHTAGPIVINQKAAACPARIRSNDVIRMSENGPDFMLNIVASAAPQRINPPLRPTDQQVISGAPRELSPDIPYPDDSPATIGAIIPAITSHTNQSPSLQEIPMLTPCTKLDHLSSAPPPAPVSSTAVLAYVERNTSRPATRERWILWVAAGLGFCAVLALLSGVLALLIRGSGPPTAPTTVSVTVTVPQDAQKNATPPVNEGGKNNLTRGETTPSSPPPLKEPSTEERILKQIKDAVFLIQVEKAGHFWPMAVCCAVGKHALLTSAREASDLYEKRQNPDKGFKIWAVNPENHTQIAVEDVYVHAVYTTLEDKPTNWIYYDFALLTVAEELPETVELASAEELASLKETGKLSAKTCVYFCGSENMKEFEDFHPGITQGKIFVITAAPPDLPSHPRLLQITGNMFKDAFGGPVLNDQAKIVAIYGATIQPEGMKELHLAPVINPEMIALGLMQKYEKIWVAPNPRKSNSEPKDEQ